MFDVACSFSFIKSMKICIQVGLYHTRDKHLTGPIFPVQHNPIFWLPLIS